MHHKLTATSPLSFPESLIDSERASQELKPIAISGLSVCKIDLIGIVRIDLILLIDTKLIGWIQLHLLVSMHRLWHLLLFQH